jgi:hypothetical protein
LRNWESLESPISLAQSDYINYYSVNVIIFISAPTFLGFSIGGFFLALWFRLFFQVSTLATILTKKQFFSMAAIFSTSIVGYSNPHLKIRSGLKIISYASVNLGSSKVKLD